MCMERLQGCTDLLPPCTVQAPLLKPVGKCQSFGNSYGDQITAIATAPWKKNCRNRLRNRQSQGHEFGQKPPLSEHPAIFDRKAEIEVINQSADPAASSEVAQHQIPALVLKEPGSSATDSVTNQTGFPGQPFRVEQGETGIIDQSRIIENRR